MCQRYFIEVILVFIEKNEILASFLCPAKIVLLSDMFRFRLGFAIVRGFLS